MKLTKFFKSEDGIHGNQRKELKKKTKRKRRQVENIKLNIDFENENLIISEKSEELLNKWHFSKDAWW
jgi:hypothetical protein